MKTCYVCHSGGYDSTTMLYELCKNAIARKQPLEIFPIYLRYSARPYNGEIYHANKSIKYFNEIFRYDNIIIHPLIQVNFNEFAIHSIDESLINKRPVFNTIHSYYSKFLVHLAQCLCIKGCNDIFFGFHKGDAIFSYIKYFEDSINSLRKLSFFGVSNAEGLLSDDLAFEEDGLELRFHYPLKSVSKREILTNYVNNPIFRDKFLCYSCECNISGRFNEKFDSYQNGLSETLHECEKCQDIENFLSASMKQYSKYLFNECKYNDVNKNDDVINESLPLDKIVYEPLYSNEFIEYEPKILEVKQNPIIANCIVTLEKYLIKMLDNKNNEKFNLKEMASEIVTTLWEIKQNEERSNIQIHNDEVTQTIEEKQDGPF